MLVLRAESRFVEAIANLESTLEHIWEVARKFGLDPFPTRFEIVPATVMYEIGSYALPGRYSHWTFGKAYHRMKTMYDFGLSKIYEVVINTNPAYGFLLETNSPLQNKLVMAHVLGHVDFFKNNVYFSRTNRRMVESASGHYGRMTDYEFKYGRKTVESLLDAVLSIEEHIDPNFFIKRENNMPPRKELEVVEGRYDDLWKIGEKREVEEPKDERPRGDALPEKDIVSYIMRNSPHLQPWQRDVVAMIHEEMEYFVPQMQTKIMNEGWASYWHSRIMRELDLNDSDHLEFAELHSGVVSPHKGQLNPYYLGYKIFEDIERRWDNPTEEERKVFGREPGGGRAKIFEVREMTITDKRWERVRDQLVSNMTNFGFPYIEVTDGDYNGNRELFLHHSYEGTELDTRYARKTLEHVYSLWGRPVHLETVIDGEPAVLRFNGEDHEED